MHFPKDLVVCSSVGREILAFGSHWLAKFQPILSCLIPNFKLKYEDSEDIRSRSCKCSRFQFASNQTSGVYVGTPGRYQSSTAV